MFKFSSVTNGMKKVTAAKVVVSTTLAVAVVVVTLGVMGQSNAAEAYVCGPFGCTPTCFVNAFGFWVCG